MSLVLLQQHELQAGGKCSHTQHTATLQLTARPLVPCWSYVTEGLGVPYYACAAHKVQHTKTRSAECC